MRNVVKLWNLVLVAGGLGLLMAVAVHAGETPAAPVAPAAPAATSVAGAEKPAAGESAEEVQKHHAAGEVKYADKWMPLMELFEMYRKALADVKAVGEKGEGGKDRLTEINKALAQILADWRKEKQPVENAKNAATAKKQLAERVLATRPPPPPQLLREPTGGGGGWGGYSGGGGGNRNSDIHYQRELERVRAENQRRQEAYQRDLARYNEYRNQATAALEESKNKIAECDKKLSELVAARKVKEKPLMEERTELNKQLRSTPQQAASKTNLASAMEESLRAAPLTLRTGKSIVEWKGDFYLLADLEEMYKKDKTEIDEARREAEAKARLDGKELPKDWRHPKHEEAESLNEAITRGKAGMPATK